MKKTTIAMLSLIFTLSACSSSVNNGAVALPSEVNETSDASFEKDVLEAKGPVLVDFYATWCGPCKMMTPVIDQLSLQYKNKVKVLRLDIDKNPGIASALGITAVPTFAIFKNGHAVDATEGVSPKRELAKKIDQSLAL